MAITKTRTETHRPANRTLSFETCDVVSTIAFIPHRATTTDAYMHPCIHPCMHADHPSLLMDRPHAERGNAR